MNSTPVAAEIDLKQVFHPTEGNNYYVVTYRKGDGTDRRGPTKYTLISRVLDGNTKVLDSNNEPHVFYKDRKVLFYEVPSAGNGGKRRNNRRKSAKKGGRSRRMRRMRRSNNRKSSRRF